MNVNYPRLMDNEWKMNGELIFQQISFLFNELPPMGGPPTPLMGARSLRLAWSTQTRGEGPSRGRGVGCSGWCARVARRRHVPTEEHPRKTGALQI